MANGWKIVGAICLVLVVLGGILVGVGFMTGAETARIYSVIEDHYLLNETYNWIKTIFLQIF